MVDQEKKNVCMKTQLGLFKELMPQEFDFERQSPDEWITEAQDIATDIGMSEAVLIKALMTKLNVSNAADARTTGCNLVKTIKEFSEKLMEILCPETMRSRARQDLKIRTRKPGETAEQYLRQLKILGNKAFKEKDRRTEEITNKFIEGQGRNIEAELLRNRKSTLEEQITIIHDYERLWGSNNNITAKINEEHDNLDAIKKTYSKEYERKQPEWRQAREIRKPWLERRPIMEKNVKCYRCANKGHYSGSCNLSKTIQCRKCNRKGHIEKACGLPFENPLNE